MLISFPFFRSQCRTAALGEATRGRRPYPASAPDTTSNKVRHTTVVCLHCECVCVCVFSCCMMLSKTLTAACLANNTQGLWSQEGYALVYPKERIN